MRGTLGIDPGWGITLVRLAVAAILIPAGYSKVFVLGLPAVTEGMAKYGLPAPQVFAFLAAWGELAGGLTLLVGLFGRWLGLFFAIQFAIAFFWVKLRMQGFGPGRLDLMLMVAGFLFFIAGPGRAAIDAWWLERPSRRRPGSLDSSRRAA
jgi:putative oxidoreductase